MTDDNNAMPSTAGISIGSRVWLFRSVATLSACLIALLGAELLLRWRRDQIRQSDDLDRGLVRFDPDLGWTLSPGWTGRHRHRDFGAAYRVGLQGFRHDPAAGSAGTGRPLTVVIGDSFTFGLGVNDDETFVHLLNAPPGQLGEFLNCGVPGYSTDQEVLLTESVLRRLRPDRVVLVVYVANDLFDNLRAAPMQVGSRKPFFELTAGGDVVLRGHPVAAEHSRVPPEPGGLLKAVLGPDRRQWSLRHRLEQESELFRTVSQTVVPESEHHPEFPRRFAAACELFSALVGRLDRSCREQNATLVVMMLAGRSYFEAPRSLSAHYQEYLLEQVALRCTRRGLGVIDVPRLMRQGSRMKAPWFYPNDGHLTAEGHREIARHLKAGLESLTAARSQP